jgi:pimeloyl-ACP methyl ester carboxylesterase
MTLIRRSTSVSAESARIVPLDLTYPETGPAGLPLILFSHGANAAPDRYRVLLDVWAADGFVVAAPRHVESEDNPDRALHDSAAVRVTRIEDYAAVDAAMAREFGPDIPVIAAGHSYGAIIAQAAGGAQLLGGLPRLVARKPRAVIAISPPPVLPGFIGDESWHGLDVPTLNVTGDQDVMPGFVDRWEQHLAGYEVQRADQAYALVFDGIDHYFNGAFCRLVPDAPIAPIDSLNRIALAFVRDCLTGDGPSAERWLTTSAPGLRAMTRRPPSAG